MVVIKSEILNDVDSICLLSRRQSQVPITADYEALLQTQWKRAGEVRPLSTCTWVFRKMVSSLSKTFLIAPTGAFRKLLSGWRSFITSVFFPPFFFIDSNVITHQRKSDLSVIWVPKPVTHNVEKLTYTHTSSACGLCVVHLSKKSLQTGKG